MQRVATLMVLVGVGCLGAEPELFFRPNIDDDSERGRVLGVGLTVIADAHHNCDGCDVWNDRASIREIRSAAGDLSVRRRENGGLAVIAPREGFGAFEIEMPTRGPDCITVRTRAEGVATAAIEWGHHWNLAGHEGVGAVFAGSSLRVVQRHRNAAGDELLGTAALTLDRGNTAASLVAPSDAAPAEYAIDSLLVVGDELGAARLSTASGASVDLEIRAASAVSAVAFFDGESTDAEPLALERTEMVASSGWRTRARLVPMDDDGRAIAGCPETGPTVSAVGVWVAIDREGALCGLDMGLEEGVSEGVIAVRWGAARATLALRENR